MNDVQIALLAARTLIADPECWTKGTYARNSGGHQTPATASGACSWCALGAIHAAVAPDTQMACTAARAFAMRVGDIVAFNDHRDRTHAEVLAAFDRAIELAA